MELGGRKRRRRGGGGGGGGQSGYGGQQGYSGQQGTHPGPQGGFRAQPQSQPQGQPQSGFNGPASNGHPSGGQSNNGQPYGGRPEPRPEPRPAPRPQVLDVDGNPLTKPDPFRPFEELTSVDPSPRLTLEYPGCPPSCRLIDLFCPIGRGQRGLIVSPPKAGKTTLLKDIAQAILRNHHDIEVVVLLVDERPEEVTDFKRTFSNPETEQMAREMLARGEAAFRENGGPEQPLTPATPHKPRCRVIASSNDHTIERHIDICLRTIDACKRMVECGKHVVVLMDSLTRVGRAFNNSRRHANSGRTMSGGLDSKALEVPRQIFGAARNTEEAGSLTIIASCLVDTGSAADQIIFEEFKGSGNMELILDRKISERRLFPAINLAESGTRKDEKLLTENEVKTITALRRRLMSMKPPDQIEQLLVALKRFPTNQALVGGAG